MQHQFMEVCVCSDEYAASGYETCCFECKGESESQIDFLMPVERKLGVHSDDLEST